MKRSILFCLIFALMLVSWGIRPEVSHAQEPPQPPVFTDQATNVQFLTFWGHNGIPWIGMSDDGTWNIQFPVVYDQTAQEKYTVTPIAAGDNVLIVGSLAEPTPPCNDQETYNGGSLPLPDPANPEGTLDVAVSVCVRAWPAGYLYQYGSILLEDQLPESETAWVIENYTLETDGYLISVVAPDGMLNHLYEDGYKYSFGVLWLPEEGIVILPPEMTFTRYIGEPELNCHTMYGFYFHDDAKVTSYQNGQLTTHFVSTEEQWCELEVTHN